MWIELGGRYTKTETDKDRIEEEPRLACAAHHAPVQCKQDKIRPGFRADVGLQMSKLHCM